jgi:threonine/homoserine/homoserine lactone efflux protein
MLPLDTLAAFFAASLLLGLAPGPDNIFVLTQSALYGRAAGLAVMLGLCTGLLVHTGAVALGVAALVRASALAFTALKLGGAAYLLVLAWQAFHAGAADLHPARAVARTRRQLYRRGIIMNVTNPKVSIFFLAFLPQFADPQRGPVALQIVLLGGVFIVATVLVFGGVALAAGALGEWLARSPAVLRVMNRVAALVFAALAVSLAASRIR